MLRAARTKSQYTIQNKQNALNCTTRGQTSDSNQSKWREKKRNALERCFHLINSFVPLFYQLVAHRINVSFIFVFVFLLLLLLPLDFVITTKF